MARAHALDSRDFGAKIGENGGLAHDILIPGLQLRSLFVPFSLFESSRSYPLRVLWQEGAGTGRDASIFFTRPLRRFDLWRKMLRFQFSPPPLDHHLPSPIARPPPPPPGCIPPF